MHREFLKLLEKATGVSEHVIAINLDIRGFTPFCQSVESMDVTTYVKKVYLRIINDYFKTASYYKPTGDGLIIIIPYTDETLKEVANSTMDSCLALLENFGSLLVDDHMINFPTPQKIGIGLTRGSACCITSEDKVLDYSGRILNLASRLMDIARPSGIVFDESFRIDLLSDETKELFSEETVYVRGVAEETPIKIYYAKRHTLLPDSYKQPVREPKWNVDTFKYEFATLRSLQYNLSLKLSKKPLNENKITVRITHPNPKVKGFQRFHDFSIEDEEVDYTVEGSIRRVSIDTEAVNELLKKERVRKDMTIKFDIMYPIR